MLVKLAGAGIDGIEAFSVEVEVDVRKALGPASFTIVGLPGAGVKESKDRVEVALRNSGFSLRTSVITVNLAPADRRKEGPAFELPMAIALLGASEAFSTEKVGSYMIVGELGLDGTVRPVRGCLPIALECRKGNFDGLICPEANANEAGVVKDIDVIPVKTLTETVEFLAGLSDKQPVDIDINSVYRKAAKYEVDFSEVRGQYAAKRALCVAAAGGHNVLMIGPPGSGKSMIAQRIPTILPDLTLEESLETTKIYSVAGLMAPGQSLTAARPFRSPHHTVSSAGLIGGGTSPRPGEISLAHHGLLFLDELPEFGRGALEGLRQPMEDGRVTISRVQSTMTYPAQFMLVAAMNPCPCGYMTDPKRKCRCSTRQVQQYLSRISGPLMDRIDIHIDVPPVEYSDLRSRKLEESSESIKKQVAAARAVQTERFKNDNVFCNARMKAKYIEKYCRLDSDGETLLKHAMEQLRFSARAYTKILRTARTIADLAQSEDIRAEHLGEAIQYRTLDRYPPV